MTRCSLSANACKKVILCLSIIALSSLIAMPEFAMAEALLSGECGENLLWTLEDDGALSISGSGEMFDFGQNTAPWSGLEKRITVLSLSDGVKSVGSYAFYGCTRLRSVAFPESLERIGDVGFAGCCRLKQIPLFEGIESIGIGAFAYCTGLEGISFPISANGGTVKEWCFSECDSLTSLTLKEGITKLETGAFSGCSKLYSVTLPKSLAVIGNYAFSECDALTSMELPYVSEIGHGAFYRCEKLGNLFLGKDGLSTQTVKSRAFGECKSLLSVIISTYPTSVDLSAFEGSNAEFYCTTLEIHDRVCEELSPSAPFPVMLCRDVNLDKRFDAEDTLIVLMHLAGAELSEGAENIFAGDFNLDGRVSLADLSYSMKLFG